MTASTLGRRFTRHSTKPSRPWMRADFSAGAVTTSCMTSPMRPPSVFRSDDGIDIGSQVHAPFDEAVASLDARGFLGGRGHHILYDVADEAAVGLPIG